MWARAPLITVTAGRAGSRIPTQAACVLGVGEARIVAVQELMGLN